MSDRLRFGAFVPPHHLPVNYNPTYALQRDTEIVQLMDNIGFGCVLLFDHNWANWATKKHHYELFGDYVIPHFKKTNRRLKISETATRAVRDELAAAQMAAISDFAAKHAAPVKDAAAAAEQEGHSDDRAD